MENTTSQKKIFVILVNYNGSDDTIECVQSLLSIDYKNIEILIVDNGSDTEQIKILKDKLSDRINIIYLENNIGFAGGNNAGIKYSLKQNADYILLLNNDTIVESNLLTVLMNSIRAGNNIGICGPGINYYSDHRRIWSVGGKISKIRGTGVAIRKLKKNEKDSDKYVSFVSGCCMLIKKEVFQKVGNFDDNFFLYVEDADFCYRTIKAGFKICFNPQVKIYHKVGNSTKSKSPNISLYYTTRNRLFFAKKYFQNIFFLTVLYIFITMSIKSIFWIFTGKTSNISTVRKSFKDFFDGKMGKREL